jgi:predicted Rossmann-fold nucleotide-binding protein
MDELFESLTLIQTGKALSFPVVLCGTAHWAGLVRWVQARMLEEKLISRGDMDLVQMSDSPEEIVEMAIGPPDG